MESVPQIFTMKRIAIYLFCLWLGGTMLFTWMINLDSLHIRVHGGPTKLYEQIYYQAITIKEMSKSFITIF